MKDEKPVLTDENIEPSEKVLKNVLKNVYPIYKELIEEITSENYKLNAEWKYYKDGKSWLCKVVNKKRTIFWISVWEEYFKVAFYFTEKFDEQIANSGISESLIKQYLENKPIGKLKPLTIDVNRNESIKEIIKLINIRK